MVYKCWSENDSDIMACRHATSPVTVHLPADFAIVHLPTDIHLTVTVHPPIDTAHRDSPSSRRHYISPTIQLLLLIVNGSPSSHRDSSSIADTLAHPDDTQHLFIPAFCSLFLFFFPRGGPAALKVSHLLNQRFFYRRTVILVC